MRSIPAFLFLLLVFQTVTAQLISDTAIVSKIRDEAINHSQIAVIAHHLTDMSGPRLTNSPGYKRASTYIVKTLKEWKLVNAGEEPWGEFGKGWSNEYTHLSMRTPYYENLNAYPLAWTKGTTKPVMGAGVVLFDSLDSAIITARASEIKGKVVMVKARSTAIQDAFQADARRYSDSELVNMKDLYMMERNDIEPFIKIILRNYNTLKYLEQKGAVAVLSRSPHNAGTVIAQGSIGFAKGYPAVLPQLQVAAENYLKLQRILESGGKVSVDIDVKNSWISDNLTGYNVVGELPGTDPKLKEQVVMLGGHLDSWHAGTGATDNAAGCIVMMEVMRILKTIGVQPRRTIRIALWGGEEQGLLGSFGYVKKHFGDPRDMKLSPQQQKVSAYYNLDNGSGKIRGIFAQGNEQVKDLFQSWLAPFADLGATTVTMSNTGSTDHISFDAVGIPGFQFIQDPLDYETRTHHTNMDVYDHLSIEDLKQAAAVIAYFVYNTAMREEMIPRKPLPKPARFAFDFDTPL